MMTKRMYIALALAIREVSLLQGADPVTLQTLAERICDVLVADNHLFERDTFLRASGMLVN